MIIATFNVENLFERPCAMNFPTWTMGQGAIDAAGELNARIAEVNPDILVLVEVENKDRFQASDHHGLWAAVDL